MDTHSAYDVGIIGAGVIGLTSALSLARAGYKVAIVARDLPGDDNIDWASPWAGAAMLPFAEGDDRDIKMQLCSFRQYWAIAHQDAMSGVQKVKVTEFWDGEDARANPWYASVMPNFRTLSASELPPETSGGNCFMSLAINPHRFLPWMQHHLESLYGITFHRRNLKSVEEIRDVLPCEIIINASGLGAKSLASDASVSAVRGQTMLIKSSALKVNMNEHVMIRRGKEYTYVIPRSFSGGVVIGGIEDEANLDVRVDGKLRQDILRRVNRMTGGTFSDVDLESDVIKDIVGFRPGRRGGYRIERQGNIVHAYGFAGAGYRYSFGAAARVVDLVDELGFVPKPRL